MNLSQWDMGPDNNSLYFSSHNLNGCGRVGVERPASGLIQHLYLPANYPAMRGYPPTPTTLHSLQLYWGLAAANSLHKSYRIAYKQVTHSTRISSNVHLINIKSIPFHELLLITLFEPYISNRLVATKLINK